MSAWMVLAAFLLGLLPSFVFAVVFVYVVGQMHEAVDGQYEAFMSDRAADRGERSRLIGHLIPSPPVAQVAPSPAEMPQPVAFDDDEAYWSSRTGTKEELAEQVMQAERDAMQGLG